MTNQSNNKNTAKEQFLLADFSYEIRNPLNGIMGLTEILKDTQLNSEQKSLLDKIQKNNDHLLDILNQMLEYSKLLDKNIQCHPRQLLISPFLHNILEELFQYYQKERIKLCYYIPPNLSGIAMLDSALIKQVFLSIGKHIKFLCSDNTINLEFTETNHILYITFKFIAKQNLIPTNDSSQNTPNINAQNINFELSKGILELMGGEIQEKLHENIFEIGLHVPLYNKTKSQKTNSFQKNDLLRGKSILFFNYKADSCTSISKYLDFWGIKLHIENAEIDQFPWENQQNKYHFIGLDISNNKKHEFQIMDAIKKKSNLPIIMFKDPNKTNQKILALQKDVVVMQKPISSIDIAAVLKSVIQSKANELREWLRNPLSLISEYQDQLKILIVEDEPINQRIMREYLNRINLKADLSSNGQQAVKWYKEKEYDLILMDIQMPIMDGAEATKIIRNLKGKHQPYIVAITADSSKGNIEFYKNLGMDDLFYKPISLIGIQKIIAKYLKTIKGI
ncbi:MAG: hypothetical protein B7C24_09365 [Bacteroidetes bacterium 4572_77]|nr:MAG: hypothetical protein B7C24_09365 [Bacteroidetes bacterium 4572_77]